LELAFNTFLLWVFVDILAAQYSGFRIFIALLETVYGCVGEIRRRNSTLLNMIGFGFQYFLLWVFVDI